MKVILAIFAIVTLLGTMMIPGSFAHPHHNITITQIDDHIALETVTTTMSIPDNPNLQWATIKGTISDPVDWYPVIIQIYKGNDPIQFAQVNLLGDDSYAYQFQIRTTDDGSILDVFEGEYMVKVSAVVYHSSH